MKTTIKKLTAALPKSDLLKKTIYLVAFAALYITILYVLINSPA
jgi:hypothetical protein